ncbi:MAG TPA: M20/M25/M40 family metallo-hydrolase [Bryobacteraceae bacterium]|nr:M20/M25/M40 family metallo-hydrolase [Bryobacteraceae bacterium]
MMRLLRATAAITAFAQIAWTQADPVIRDVRRYRQAHEHQIVRELMDLIAVPNVAGDAAALRRNAELIAKQLERRGLRARLLENDAAAPVVFGEQRTPGATKTVVFYSHYDGSPVNAADWASPPFTPVLRSGPIEKDGQPVAMPEPGKTFDPEWRLYGRSSADAKAPIVALLAALDALKAAGRSPAVNVKVVFEGEEEYGSKHLESTLARHKDLLQSDIWLVCDGPVHASRNAQIMFGARGIASLVLTVYGARRELHSGHYGNWAPNPAFLLAQLLASMKDAEGKVLIEGFHEGVEPLGAAEKQALAELPAVEAELRKELALGRTEGGGRALAELITEPSLNVRAIASSSHVGEDTSNVIPSFAKAAIDMRLVKGVTAAQAISRLKAHIVKQGYFIVDREPDAATLMAHPKVARFSEDHSYDAARTAMDLPIAQSVMRAAGRATERVLKLPTMGGSLPLVFIERPLNARTIVLPIVNHDNRQHSTNENLRLQNLWDGIELMAAMLTMQ